MLARSSDPGTSHLAAHMASVMAKRHEHLVYTVLANASLAIGAEQIALHAGLDAYQVRKRLPELQSQGLAEPTGETRKTMSGRQERLWRLKLTTATASPT